MVDVSMSGMAAIRYYSETKEWIDFVVFVSRQDKATAEGAIALAMDAFFDDEYETYGDAVKIELKSADIPFVMVPYPQGSYIESMEYENWADNLADSGAFEG